jgi:hypothetical protein
MKIEEIREKHSIKVNSTEETNEVFRFLGNLKETYLNHLTFLDDSWNKICFIEKTWRLSDNTLSEYELPSISFQELKDLLNESEEWIPKVGDWIVITAGNDNWVSDMNKFIGNVVQITKTREGKYTEFVGFEGWSWNLSEGHFRKAELHEIPKKSTTESKSHFEIGKWYQNAPSIKSYAKCLEIRENGNSFYFKDFIDGCDYRKTNSSWSYHGNMREVELSEIQQYLPEDHPDKLHKPEPMNKESDLIEEVKPESLPMFEHLTTIKMSSLPSKWFIRVNNNLNAIETFFERLDNENHCFNFNATNNCCYYWDSSTFDSGNLINIDTSKYTELFIDFYGNVTGQSITTSTSNPVVQGIELIPNEFYAYRSYIFQYVERKGGVDFDVKNQIDKISKQFRKGDYWSFDAGTLAKATAEEITHCKQCIAAGKYVEYSNPNEFYECNLFSIGIDPIPNEIPFNKVKKDSIEEYLTKQETKPLQLKKIAIPKLVNN